MFNLQKKKLIQKNVDSLLELASYRNNFSLEVEKLISLEGINLLKQPLNGISGMSFVNEQGSFIVVNSTENSRQRKRFTMAHELGHLVLHHSSPVSVSEESGVLLRDINSSKGEDLKEIEANYFAACLLMPSNKVSSYLSEVSHLSEDFITDMAKKFDVSVMAMTIRLTNLGYF